MSFILRGYYKERRSDTTNIYVSLRYWRWWWKHRHFDISFVNRMVANDAVAHTIYECRPDTLTLVFYGPRKRMWGYHTPYGWVSWKEFKPV